VFYKEYRRTALGPTNPVVFHKSVVLLTVDVLFFILNLIDADCSLSLSLSVCLMPPYFILLEVMIQNYIPTANHWTIWSAL
jgi:hypothetical protein